MVDKDTFQGRGPDAAPDGPARSPLRKLGVILILLVFLGLLFGGLFWWRAERQGAGGGWSQGPTPVAAMEITSTTAPVKLEAVGSLRAVQEVMLAPETQGRVVEIGFKGGQTVEEGQVLVQMFDAPEQADLAAAKASLALARAQLARAERLASTGAGSRENLDQRRAQRDQAVASVDQIEARIRQKQILAPFSGEIGLRHVNLGEYLNAGTSIATLTAIDPLFVDFYLPQAHFSRLTKGSPVEVLSDAWPDRTFMAEVTAIEPQVGEDTRNVLVQATLDNAAGALRPGMYVSASLVLPPQENAVVVPATAIMTSAQGESAAVIRGENARQSGTAEIVPVVTDRRIGNNVVVAQGLAPGDVVVVEGQLRVQPQAPLEVTDLVTLEDR